MNVESGFMQVRGKTNTKKTFEEVNILNTLDSAFPFLNPKVGARYRQFDIQPIRNLDNNKIIYKVSNLLKCVM
jgi:hypothetical protein